MALKDRRYAISPEFTGHHSGKRQFVVRFNGKYINSFPVKHDAEMYISTLKEKGTEYTLSLL